MTGEIVSQDGKKGYKLKRNKKKVIICPLGID